MSYFVFVFFFSSRRRHTRWTGDWSSDVCSSDLHGPFLAADVARRLGLGVAVVEQTLVRLEGAGRVVAGEFRPGGAGREWLDAEVLRRLRRRSLAALRKEVEPVPQAAL